MLNIRESFSFDDVMLSPKYSEIKSRKDVDLNISLSKGIGWRKEGRFAHPIIPANMATITGRDMAATISQTGGLSILHRFMPLKEQIAILKYLREEIADGVPCHMDQVGFSVGVKEEDYKNVRGLYDYGARIFCIDIAHGDSLQCVEMTKYISTKFPDVFLIAGNIATAEGAKRLWLAGADACKTGVGSGSLCSTRIETGNGVPQLTALSDVYDMRERLITASKGTFYKDNSDAHGQQKVIPPMITKPIFIIADGGIRSAGDCVKSLCFADMVMTGNLFAGAEETPGEILRDAVSGEEYKSYIGSSTHKTNHIEGVASIVKKKGSAKDIIAKLCEGIRSGCSYQGVSNVVDLKKDPQFVRITNAGLKESHPHIDGRIV